MMVDLRRHWRATYTLETPTSLDVKVHTTLDGPTNPSVGGASAVVLTAGRHLEDSPQCEDPALAPLDKGEVVG